MKGPRLVSYTVLLTGVVQVTGRIDKLGEDFFSRPVDVTVRELVPVV